VSLRKHRDDASGKRTRPYRMPKVEDIKLGTKIEKEAEKDEKVPSLDKCSSCGEWFEIDDLEQNICFGCFNEIDFLKEE